MHRYKNTASLKVLLLLTALVLLSLPLRAHAQDERPNILFILADDLGWSDTEPYGSTFYETPRISRLAEEGMRFTDAYVAPLCSATRASVLTGLYPAHVRIMRAVGHRDDEKVGYVPERDRSDRKVVEPVDRNHLLLEERTIAEALKDAGYNTYHLGKWHLGYEEQYYPHNQGFDHVVGVGGGGPGSYFSPHNIPLLVDGPEGEHLDDRLTKETIQILENERVKEGPFFIYLAHHSIHGPWEAKEELTAHFTKKMRKREVPGHQQNPINAAKVKSLDESVGAVLDHLEELGMADNTIVVFLGDNGGVVHISNPVPVTSNHPLRNGKATIYEGGVRVPLIVRWPNRVEPGTVNEQMVHGADVYPTFLEVAGASPQSDKELDGISIVPTLTKQAALPRNALFGHFPWYMGNGQTPASWTRQGDYKLIRLYGEGPGRTPLYELYNLEEDIGEKNDLAAKMPGKVAELTRLMDAWLEDIDALIPVVNPDYDPDLAGTK